MSNRLTPSKSHMTLSVPLHFIHESKTKGFDVVAFNSKLMTFRRKLIRCALYYWRHYVFMVKPFAYGHTPMELGPYIPA